MNVQELIKELSKLPMDVELVFGCVIESGRSMEFCNEGSLSMDHVQNYSYEDQEGESVELGERVLIQISGESSSWE